MEAIHFKQPCTTRMRNKNKNYWKIVMVDRTYSIFQKFKS